MLGAENNILLNVTAQNTIRLAPPLIINSHDVEYMLDKLYKTIKIFG